MSSGIFLGLDHGGTTTTAILFEPGRGKLASHSVHMPKSSPAVGLVQHVAEDFVSTSIAASAVALEQAGLNWTDVQAIGIANQGETSMAWSAQTGASLGPALSWEDQRSAAICESLGQPVDDLIRSRTGVVLDPYFSASKFKWLVENLPDVTDAAKAGQLRLGGSDAFLISQLTGGQVHATEAGTASRTALFNLRDLIWDEDITAAFGLETRFLPQIMPSCGPFGIARHENFGGVAIPITANAVDAHAALFAQGCKDRTTVKATYGTGAFIEINTGNDMIAPDGNALVLIGWNITGRPDYTLEAGVLSVGSAIDWAARTGLIPSAEATAALASSVPDCAGVTMVPCLSGLSAPYWQPNARGSINGLGLHVQPAHIARALLDGIAFQCADIIRALDARAGGYVTEILADGGPTKNTYLMQRQADLLNKPISVSLEPDMTGLGAAMLAAVGAGALTTDEAHALPIARRTYYPTLSEDERESLWADWRHAAAATSDFSKRRAI